MKQQVCPDDSLETLFRSNDSTSDTLLEKEFPLSGDSLLEKEFPLSGGSFLARAPSLASSTKICTPSQDTQDSSFLQGLMKECEEEFREHQKGPDGHPILWSSESVAYVSKLFIQSNDGSTSLCKSQGSTMEPLPFETKTGVSRSAETLNLDDAHNYFSSRDWMPALDECEDAKKVDDSINAIFFESRPAFNDAQEPPVPYTPQPRPFQSKSKTDWAGMYESQLPPATPAAPRPVEPKEAVKAPKKKELTKSRKVAVVKKRARKVYEPKIKVYVEPTDKDILHGRGGRSNHHVGNLRYHKEKLKIQKRYMASSKEEKTSVSQEFVDIVHGWGGRFLKLEDGKGWYEVPNIVARKKVSQALREINTAERRRAKRAFYANQKCRKN